MFTNDLNMGLLLWAFIKKKKQSMEWKHTDSLVKKVPGTAVSKGDTDSLLGHERAHHYWFPRKKHNCKQCFLLPTP